MLHQMVVEGVTQNHLEDDDKEELSDQDVERLTKILWATEIITAVMLETLVETWPVTGEDKEPTRSN